MSLMMRCLVVGVVNYTGVAGEKGYAPLLFVCKQMAGRVIYFTQYPRSRKPSVLATLRGCVLVVKMLLISEYFRYY